MSNTVGTITVEMLANVASMVSDLGKAQSETTKAARAHARAWQESNEAIKESFKGLLELIGVGISVDWLKDVAIRAYEGAEKLDHLSQSLGVSVQALQVMKYAAETTGTDIDTAAQAFIKLEKNAELAAAGSAQQVEAFRALGISAAQLNELLKDPEQLLQTVTQRIAEAGDGAAKTALILDTFGRGGATLIPYLKELGEHFDEIKLRAIEFGVVLSGQDQAALLAANEGLDTAAQAAKGLANQFAVALAPAVNAITQSFIDLVSSGGPREFFQKLGDDISQFLIVGGEVKDTVVGWADAFRDLLPGAQTAFSGMGGDLVSFVQAVKDAAVEIANHFANNWERMKAVAAVFWNDLTNQATRFVATTKVTLAGLADIASNLEFLRGDLSGAKGLAEIGAQLRASAAASREASVDLTQYSNAIKANNEAAAASIAENQKWADGIRLTSDSFRVMTTGIDQFTASLKKGDLVGNSEKLAEAQKNINDTAAEMIRLGANEAKVHREAGAAMDLLAAAVAKADAQQIKYNAASKDGRAELDKSVEAMLKLDEVIANLASKSSGPYAKALADYNAGLAQLERAANNAAIAGGNVDEILAKWQQGEEELDRALDATTDRIIEQTDIVGQLEQQLDNETRLLEVSGRQREIEKALIDAETDARKQYNLGLRESASLTREEIDGISSAISAHYDYNEALKSSQQLLQSWVSTAQKDLEQAFNSIITNIEEGGSVMSGLVDVAKTVVNQIISEFLKLAVINPILQSIFGSAAGSLPTLSNSGGLISQFLNGGGSSGGFSPSGITSLAGNTWSRLTGAYTYTPSGFYGPPSDLANDFMGPPSGAAGGYGQYGGYNSAFGQALGIGGGILAGYSAYKNAGGGLGGVAAGAAYGIGTYYAGAAVSTALAGGVSAGLAAIPVVGWIALAAMLVDKFSGGKLFGTGFAPTGNAAVNFDVSGAGADVSAQLEERKNQSLFRGHKWRWVDTDVDQQTQDAFSQFFTGLQDAIQQGAKALGVAVPDIVEGSFKETLDKKGNITSQVSTVLGQKFDESIEQFQQRIIGENLLALLPSEAEEIAQKWRSSAETLLAGSQFLVQAQLDVQHGMSLLGNDSSLKDIDAIVEKLGASGESLIDTYVRLQAETQSMHLALDQLGLHISETGADFVQFSDDMVKAAGSLQNLQTLWGDYFTNFYSQNEQAAAKLRIDRANAALLGAAIGQDPNESMADFRANFEAVIDSLSAGDVVNWLRFAEALAAVNSDLGNSAQATEQQQAQLADFMSQFETNTFTEFESAINGLGASMAENIDKANSFGASLQDIGRIVLFTATQGVAAFHQLEQNAGQIAASLYGTTIDQLQAQIDKYKGSTLDVFFTNGLKEQIAQIQAQQEAAQRLGQATALLQDFGQLGAFTGKSLTDLSGQFGVPLERFAKDLGLDGKGLEEAFKYQEQLAAAAITQTDYLKDIRDLLEGKTLTIPDLTESPQDLIGSKLVRNRGVDSSSTVDDIVSAVTDQTQQTSSDSAKTLAEARETNQLLRQLLGAIGTAPAPIGRTALALAGQFRVR